MHNFATLPPLGCVMRDDEFDWHTHARSHTFAHTSHTNRTVVVVVVVARCCVTKLAISLRCVDLEFARSRNQSVDIFGPR